VLCVSPLELQTFYEDFARSLRARGVVCAITSGMACVHYGIAETTKDCDLLCHPGAFGALLDLLEETRAAGAPCGYRGNISPPLDARWHLGGWTSHFEWLTGLDACARGALNAERKLWEELDRRRIQILERSLRPYVSAVRKTRLGRELSLRQDHEIRIACAIKHLPNRPLQELETRSFINDAINGLVESGLIPESGLAWLPDVTRSFQAS
jgi:hypothetical protein